MHHSVTHSQRAAHGPNAAKHYGRDPKRSRLYSAMSRDWRDSYSARVSASQRDAIICDFLECLGSPRALSTWLLYKYGEHRQLVEQRIDPHAYTYEDREKFRCDYAAVKFLSKCADLTTGIDTEAVAIASAREAEAACRATNEWVRDAFRQPRVSGAPEFLALLAKTSKIVERILGPLPPLNYDSWETEGLEEWDVGFSPGRTTSAFGEHVASMYKYASRLDVTWSAQERAYQLVKGSPTWAAAALNADAICSALRNALNRVEGNVLITVPKNAKTDRVICYEPHLNVRMQLAVGRLIRVRLLRNAGVNLNDQSVNQRRARIAAQRGNLSTIDLSMASDTIAYELVRAIFSMSPVLIDWLHVLDSLRSRNTLWPGDTAYTRNEKFSSMGNGFTFELESLLFYAICSSVGFNVSVFGDDIIVPTECFDACKDALLLCGFALNPAKSFKTSYFRESCGTDMFGYLDCTPVYLRRLPKTMEDTIKLHNQVRAFISRDAGQGAYVKYASRYWGQLLWNWRRVHPALWGPEGFGDGHYHVNLDEARPARAGNWLEGWWYRSVIRKYPVSTIHGDRVHGAIPERYGYAALCAALGPKRTERLVSSIADRRQTVLRVTRALAHKWPEIVWV